MSVKKIAIFLLFMFCANAYAESNNVVDALRATYENCVGIDESLNDIKKMAGINTAIGAVGTGMGVGATAVGIAKKKVDAEAEKIEIKFDKPFVYIIKEKNNNNIWFFGTVYKPLEYSKNTKCEVK